jgi:hypothetical protein
MGTTRLRRRAAWRELVSEQARNGQDVTAFCRERGIRTTSFYDWKKPLGVDDESRAGVSIVCLYQIPPAGFRRRATGRDASYASEQTYLGSGLCM